MSLGLVVAGTIFQFMLAYMAFLGAVFGGGAAGGNRPLSVVELRILDGAMYVLPGLCVFAALVVIGLYLGGGGGWSLLWHLLPVAALILYGWYVFSFLAR